MLRKRPLQIAISPAQFDQRAADADRTINEALGFQLRSNQIETSRILLRRSIAELSTGEGKTLAAIVAISLMADQGGGVLVCTANDYLARRDAAALRDVYLRLGLSCDSISAELSELDRRAAYDADITYGTIREFGFDFLRDRVAARTAGKARSEIQPIQREPACLVVDEADSVLIDEASTPLVISGPKGQARSGDAACYLWAASVAQQFESPVDYVRISNDGMIALTKAGRARVQRLQIPQALRDRSLSDLLHAIELAIFVNERFVRNRDYLTHEGRVQIVDEFTGRVSAGRSWSDGLHQAIEAREGLPLTSETGVIAQITVQDYVRQFPVLSGMTGTAYESRRELYQVYDLNVEPVPDTHRSLRETMVPRILPDQASKWHAIADEAGRVAATGRAVLIGTRTVDQSNQLAESLNTGGLDPVVLNASNPDQEAEIVALAGQPARITVATNMAGRGTDIPLAESVRVAGGLHVIATEFHASSRIDRQLAGRGARFGDPGSFQQFCAWDDEIFSMAHGPERAIAIRNRLASRHDASTNLRPFLKAQSIVQQRQQKQRRALAAKTEHLADLYRSLNLDPVLDQFDS